jgi:Ca2+-binding EF-hand superfamily protein
MRRFLPLTALVLVLTAGSLAIAQQPGGPGPIPGRDGHGPGGFGPLEFDANADGKLTKTEFDNGQRARFNELDANKDGFTTRDEMRASADERHAKGENARFAMLDTDKNGQLSQSEFAAARERGPGPDGLRLRMGRGRPDGPGAAAGFGRGGRIGPDADNDGKVSFAEFSARGSEAFTRADANKDGTVTVAELQTLLRGQR